MAYEKKEGEISVFENDKQGNEKRPDFKGTALINGKEYEVALWKKESSKGIKFLSGMVKQAGEKSEKKETKKEEEFIDDDIPFDSAWGQ